MKHINKKYIIMFILLNFAFVLFFSVIWNYFQYFNEIEKSNMLYMNTFAEKLYIRDSHEFINKLKDHKIKSFIIWQKLNNNLVGLLYSGDFNSPPITKGRFFVPLDFYCNKRLAVIGKDVLPLATNEENGLSIDLFGNRYKVIGVVGYNYSSNLDNSIFFNLDSNVSSDIFYVDGKNSSAIKITLSDLSKIVTIKRIDDPPHGLGRLFGYSIKNLKIKVVCILIYLVSIMLSIQFFINANYGTIITQHLIGISLLSIIFRLSLQLCAYILIVLFIGIFVSYVILPTVFIWQVEKQLPEFMVLLGAWYWFPQLIGASFHLYIKMGRAF